MLEGASTALSASQVSTLESLLRAGFQFITFEQFARYPAVEKSGFVCLLDLSGGRVTQFGTIGYHFRGGVGVLIERSGKKEFVWKDESLAATPELLDQYASVKRELARLLVENSKQ